MRLVVTRFNFTNNRALKNLTDAQLPCAGANPALNEIKTGIINLIFVINYIDGPVIPNLSDVEIPGTTSDNLGTAISNAVVKLIQP
jgi:hypothetical protein